MAVDILDVVFPGTEADRLGVFGDVCAVLAVDALLQGLGVIPGGIGVVENQVQASLVQRHGIGGSEDADVLESRCRRRSVTVAVDGHVVHHVDVDDILALLLEVIVNGLGRGCHRLQETVLIVAHPSCGAASGGVDVELATA